MPPNRALPYPRVGISTTRAPLASAISREPSVLPLSATRTSPATPLRSKKSRAFAMHRAIVFASFKQGIRIVSSQDSAIKLFRRPRASYHGPNAAVNPLSSDSSNATPLSENIRLGARREPLSCNDGADGGGNETKVVLHFCTGRIARAVEGPGLLEQ